MKNLILLGNKLKIGRKDNQMLQKELVDILRSKYGIKMKCSDLSKIENGKADIKLNELRAISDILGLNEEELICLSDLLEIELEFENKSKGNFKMKIRRC